MKASSGETTKSNPWSNYSEEFSGGTHEEILKFLKVSEKNFLTNKS